ncbi:hypothetical protein JK358_33270 [Nocardia sp. 2]|uniref:YbaB/EbfC DNA-binding family protein n=1 Tax=Nocardia acididurans TaxID=2802282 RepID=A0ABS1MF61_9NOCA|nr:hypothetical protein [Nocardia acididurans]MBL1079288.1 hypothetical protein [Nocardia acididurans]
MGNQDDRPANRAAALSAEDISAVQAVLRKQVAVATSRDGSVSVAASADGTIHRWERTDPAHPTDPNELVATVLDLVEQARRTAYEAAGHNLRDEPMQETPTHATDPATVALNQEDAFKGTLSYEDWHQDERGSRITAPDW